MNFEELLLNCDSLIKAGRIPAVADIIRDLNFAQVPRKSRQALAKICRRAGLIDQGLRLLYPMIRNERPLDEPATPAEICEYAVLLSRNGSVQEALNLLEPVDQSLAPESLLYKGFCHVSQWNYQKAAQNFEKFLASSADDYSKLIARVNLVAAYGFVGEFDAADRLLTEAIEMAQSIQATRLVGNCFELRGQIAFLRGDFSRSRAELNRSLEVLGQTGSYDQLLIYKWQSMMSAIEDKSVTPLLKFREEAVAQKHWESVRDTDYYQLKVNFDQKTFDHLLFGTPSESYRDRVLREVQHSASSSFLFGVSEGPQFDLQTGQLLGADESVSGTKIHQLLAALLKDFYAPRNMGTLFAELYPNEYFDIDSSPLRVRQILRRTRRWLEAQKIPAVIEETNGSYKLVLTGNFGIQIAFERFAIDGNSAQWQKLLRFFPPGNSFSAEQACISLNVSRTGLHRLLTWAFENKLLSKSGVNKATVYQVLSKQIPKAS
jgi:tetratricopeptide (TPR) repeat protein